MDTTCFSKVLKRIQEVSDNVKQAFKTLDLRLDFISYKPFYSSIGRLGFIAQIYLYRDNNFEIFEIFHIIDTMMEYFYTKSIMLDVLYNVSGDSILWGCYNDSNYNVNNLKHFNIKNRCLVYMNITDNKNINHTDYSGIIRVEFPYEEDFQVPINISLLDKYITSCYNRVAENVAFWKKYGDRIQQGGFQEECDDIADNHIVYDSEIPDCNKVQFDLVLESDNELSYHFYLYGRESTGKDYLGDNLGNIYDIESVTPFYTSISENIQNIEPFNVQSNHNELNVTSGKVHMWRGDQLYADRFNSYCEVILGSVESSYGNFNKINFDHLTMCEAVFSAYLSKVSKMNNCKLSYTLREMIADSSQNSFSSFGIKLRHSLSDNEVLFENLSYGKDILTLIWFCLGKPKYIKNRLFSSNMWNQDELEQLNISYGSNEISIRKCSVCGARTNYYHNSSDKYCCSKNCLDKINGGNGIC